jgi:hypothetical protein
MLCSNVSKGSLGRIIPYALKHQRILRCSFSTSPSSTATPETLTFSAYEYPTRTEAPQIVQTKASDVVQPLQHISSSNNDNNGSTTTTNSPKKVYHPSDPFDDQGTLDAVQQHQRKEELAQYFTKLEQQRSQQPQSHLLPITTTMPDFIPPNVSSDQLSAPETYITTLPNGIRVVSQVRSTPTCISHSHPPSASSCPHAYSHHLSISILLLLLLLSSS